MNDLIATLLAWVMAQSGYTIAVDSPAIEFLPTQAFVEQVCPRHAQCTVLGYYADGTGKIVLHDSLRDLHHDRRARAMLVHELVHYLQDHSGRWHMKDCRTWIEREREAYRAQLFYLASQGVHPSLLLMPPFDKSQCERTIPTPTQ